MELRQVRLFLAVAEEGSITAAARKAHLTQPALSRQIKALEDELGVPLLERGAHSISLTPAGEAMVRDGIRLVRMADQMADRVRAAGRGEVLRLAYAPSLVGSLLGLALERLSQLHPRVRVELSDCTTAEMKAGLRDGRFDLILTVPDDGDGGVDWHPVLRREWRLALPAGHRLAADETVPAVSLEGERLLLFKREDYPDYWQRVTGYFRDLGVRPLVAGEFDGISSLGAAVESGMGAALVAADGRIAPHSGRMVLKTLEPAPEPICVSAGTAGGAGPGLPCQVLIGELRKAAAEA
jgi:DNA-binding transcriptional LysR family regulator